MLQELFVLFKILEFSGTTDIIMVFSNLPSLVITVISAPGMATAFTNPLSSTINLLVSLDSQNTIVFVASDGSILTDSCNVSPTLITLLPPVILTPVTFTIPSVQPFKKNNIIKKIKPVFTILLIFLRYIFILFIPPVKFFIYFYYSHEFRKMTDFLLYLI